MSLKLFDKAFKIPIIGEETNHLDLYYKRLQKNKFGWKYVATRYWEVMTPIKGYYIRHKFFTLYRNGRLVVRPGYAWDGPSGPTIDTPSFIYTSLPHDIFYQMFRDGILNRNKLRQSVDKFLQTLGVYAGMYPWRAFYCYWFVRAFAGFAAKPKKNEFKSLYEEIIYVRRVKCNFNTLDQE